MVRCAHMEPASLLPHTPVSIIQGSTPRVLVLTGPTAVGKTQLSLALAERLDGEVVSADSVQVYKGLDIGSDKVCLLDCCTGKFCCEAPLLDVRCRLPSRNDVLFRTTCSIFCPQMRSFLLVISMTQQELPYKILSK